MVLERIYYHDHKWAIYADLVTFLLEQKPGHNKYSFSFMWCSKEWVNHYVKKNWTFQTNMAPPKTFNILTEPLVEKDKIIFFPFAHQTRINQTPFCLFCQSFWQKWNWLQIYLQCIFKIKNKKLKSEIFDGPQVSRLLKDRNFV